MDIIDENRLNELLYRRFGVNTKEVIFPDWVTESAAHAFEGCTSLSSIVIPNSVTKIRPLAFKGCTSLSSINIPEGVTEISVGAFNGCTCLTIHAQAGSYAEQYAGEHNIPFVAE